MASVNWEKMRRYLSQHQKCLNKHDKIADKGALHLCVRGCLNRIVRLWLLIAFCLAWPVASHAQDRAQVERQIESALIDVAIIESERARPDVPDDFAAKFLEFSQTQLAEGRAAAARLPGGSALRRSAERAANAVIAAPLRTDYLRHFPDPVRVRADLVRTSSGVDDAVLAGRQAGRFLMLQSALDGFSNNRPPRDVQRRQRLYALNFHDIRDRMRPTFTDTCSTLAFFCQTRQQKFYNTRGSYKFDSAPARETAAFYFPEAMRDRFFDATGIGGSRIGHKEYQAQLRAERVQREEEKAQRDRLERASARQQQWGILATVLGILGIIAFVGFLMFVVRRKAPDERKVSDNYGTADYAPTKHDIDADLFKGVFLGASALPKFKGYIFSPVHSAPESHTLIVAPSGTGKGTSVVIPTLLLYKSSLITIDPKGENAAITGRYRREQLGHTVHVINPWGMLAGVYARNGLKQATFNPLDVLDPRDANIVSTASSLASAICHQEVANDSFWHESAKAILTATLLWVVDTPGEKRTLAHVADIISGGENGDDLRKTLFVRMVASSSYKGAMRKLVAQYVRMDDRTFYGIMAQLSKSLQFLADDQIATATEHSSFNLSDLVNGRTTVYIVIPDDQMRVQAVWLKIVINAVMQTFKRHRPVQHGIRGLFLIDEFPMLGRADAIVSDIAAVRGAGLDMALIVQGLDQLNALYGASAGTILSNCGYKWFCNIKDLQTAEYVSKSFGQMTVQTVSETISGADGVTNRSFGETGRSLLFPDELLSMGKKTAFAFQPGGRPHYLKPVDYRYLSAYLSSAVQGTACNIVMPDLTAYDPNPYHPDAGQQQKPGTASGAMDRAEALAVLGLDEGATEEQVREAYKRLMTKVHPDQGGTNYLAQKLNQARDFLLGKKK